MHSIGSVILEKLLNADGGDYKGRNIRGNKGQVYEFMEYRDKGLLTVLGKVKVKRAYYYMAIELTHHLLLVQCCANSQRLKSWPSQKLRYRFSLNHQRNLPHIDKVMFSGSMAYGIMVS